MHPADMLPTSDGSRDAEDYPPICTHCGGSLTWDDCNDCDEGYTPPGLLYELDPIWYDEDDVEPCDQCDAKGGWWTCSDRKCSLERLELRRELLPPTAATVHEHAEGAE